MLAARRRASTASHFHAERSSIMNARLLATLALLALFAASSARAASRPAPWSPARAAATSAGGSTRSLEADADVPHFMEGTIDKERYLVMRADYVNRLLGGNDDPAGTMR